MDRFNIQCMAGVKGEKLGSWSDCEVCVHSNLFNVGERENVNEPLFNMWIITVWFSWNSGKI